MKFLKTFNRDASIFNEYDKTISKELNNFVKSIGEKYKDLIFYELELFNYNPEIDKISIEEIFSYQAIELEIKKIRFYINDIYAFSIQKVLAFSEIDKGRYLQENINIVYEDIEN